MLLSFLFFSLVMFIPFLVYQTAGIGFASVTVLITIVCSVILFDVVKDKLGHYLAWKTILKKVQSQNYSEELFKSKQFKKMVSERYKNSTDKILKLHPVISFVHCATVGIACLFFCFVLAFNTLTIAECIKYCIIMLAALEVFHLIAATIGNEYSIWEVILLSIFRMSVLTGLAVASASVIMLAIAIIKFTIPAIQTGGLTSIITPIVGITLLILFVKELCNKTYKLF